MAQQKIIPWRIDGENTDLVSYFAALAVGDPHDKDAVEEAIYFVPKGKPYKHGNSSSVITEMFSALGVLWYEGDATPYWTKNFGTASPGWYTRPRTYYLGGRTRKQFALDAIRFLSQNTKPLRDGQFPLGVERLNFALLERATKLGSGKQGLAAINTKLLSYQVQVLDEPSWEIEYGILSDPEEPLLAEADREFRKLERGLRAYLHKILFEKSGERWFEQSGLSPGRREKIMDRMKDPSFSASESPKALDFSEFYDLITIIEKNGSP